VSFLKQNMAVSFLQKSAGNSATTTLSSGVTDSSTSFPLTSDTAFLSGGGIVLIDEGLATEELAYYTGKVGGALTIPLANRGLEGGSAQAHAQGASVKGVFSADMWNNVVETLLNGFSATDGTVDTTKIVDLASSQSLSNKTISGYPTTSSTDVLTNKTIVQKVTSYTPAGAGTTTIDLTTGGIHNVTMPATTQTLAISNEVVGQCFIVEINNVTSQGTLTWFTTIRWAGGSAPTLTGTNGKRDVFGFRVTGTDTYDGFIVGQNI
jgi:hypothetical protein